MTRKLSSILVLALVAIAPPAAQAYLPPGFIGVSPQSPANSKDFELMREAGVESVRLPLYWTVVQEQPPMVAEANWDGFDHEVKLAAEAGIRVMPFVWGSPEWVAPQVIDLPVRSAWQRWGWSRLLREAARRYGPDGSFWEENPELPFLPIRRWEIWNEENIVTFADRPDPAGFAKLIRISGRALHGVDPGAKVILGGLFGRPLQVPPEHGLGRLPLPPLPGGQRQALLRRGRTAPLRRPRPRDGRPAREPAADHARPRRRPHADLRHRAWLGLAQRPDPLGAWALRAGAPALAGLRDALRQPPPLAGRRRLVVHLDRRRRQLHVSAAPPGC